MARYSLAQRTSGTASGAAAAELRSTSTDRIFVKEVGIFLAAATASSFGIGRPAAIGVTPTSPVTGTPMDPGNPAGTGQGAVAWGTGPTVPVVFIRRYSVPATIGTGIVFVFAEPGLIIPISSSLVVWNLATNGVADVHWEWDE